MAKTNKKRIFLSFLASVVVFSGVFSADCKAQAYGFESADVIELVNKARIAEGLSTLVHSDILDLAAKEKANDMVKNDYFAHTSPKGVDPWYWLKKAGYDYKYAGENLAINYDNAKEQQMAWMKSDSHRKNILNEKYQETGVAVVEGKIDGQTSILTVQVFGTTVVGATQTTNNSSIGKEKPALVPAKQSEVLSAESPTTQIQNVLDAPAVVSAEKEVLKQTSAVSSGFAKSSSGIQLVGLGVLALAILSVLEILSVRKQKAQALSTVVDIERQKGEAESAILAEDQKDSQLAETHLDRLDFLKKFEQNLQKIKRNHTIGIRPG